ncbi:MAG: hypothetical protein J0H82_21390 [Alphaproteobacteria bacterium]|jgi:hypothetical protein|nr:hypothetical protein [Alphaproteobacteria bacterium]
MTNRIALPATLLALSLALGACSSTPPTAAQQAQIDQQCQSVKCYCNDDSVSQSSREHVKPVQRQANGTAYCPAGQRLVISGNQGGADDGSGFLIRGTTR